MEHEDKLRRALRPLVAVLVERLAKSYVKPHVRRTKSVKVVQVRGYTDKRQAKAAGARLLDVSPAETLVACARDMDDVWGAIMRDPYLGRGEIGGL